jgi:sigma-54 dependent transcriptional regulator, acetoin dehydrogenase operon transcriptional activator AcoR
MASDGSESTLTTSAPTGWNDAAPAARPFLFLVLESAQPMASAARFALDGARTVRFVGRAAKREVDRSQPDHIDIRVPDPFMSRDHALLTCEEGGRWTFTDRSKNGSRLNGAVVHHRTAELVDGDLLELAHTFLIFRAALPCPASVGDLDAADAQPAAPGLLTLLPALQHVFGQLEHVARSQLPVIIQGESGTGKEVVARAISALSQRKGAFIGLNCAAVPESLIESELFGYRKGAFSGATEDRQGLIRAADQGTLFLDEIGEMSLALQVKLLRVLQEREVMPLGGTRPASVDIQVIAATNHDLTELVELGRFRPELFARLAGFQVDLPPLRERREDLGLLIASLLPRATHNCHHLRIDVGAARILFQRPWNLNIRELERTLGRAAVLASGGIILREHLPGELLSRPPGIKVAPSALSDVEQTRRQELIELLKKHRGNLRAVAREMGKARSQVQRWMRRYGLRAADYGVSDA